MARLDAPHREKIRKYQAIVPTVQALYGVPRVPVHGFVVGAQGTWTPLNDEVANVLGLKNGKVQRLCQIALCDTVKLVQIFFDLYGYVSRDSNGGGGGGGGHTWYVPPIGKYLHWCQCIYISSIRPALRGVLVSATLAERYFKRLQADAARGITDC